MKKYITLVALLAAGSAFANAESVTTSELINNINTQLTSQQYESGDSFNISFDLVSLGWSANNSASIIDLGSEFNNSKLRIQSNTGISSAYLGLTTGNTDPIWKVNETTWDPVSKTNSLSFEEYTGVWLSMGENKTQTTNDLTNAKITFSYDAHKNESKISVLLKSGVTDVVTYKNQEWTATNLSSVYNNSTWENVSVSVTPVPEPSAFGLLAGLGALALVSARRRRK